MLAAPVCVASGAVASKGTVVFVTPSDTLGRLHVVRIKDRLCVSNSIAFLLATANLQVDLKYLFYESDFSSIIHGLKKARKHVPTAGGSKIRLVKSQRCWIIETAMRLMSRWAA